LDESRGGASAGGVRDRARALYWRGWLAKRRVRLLGAAVWARGVVLATWLLRAAAVLAALWALVVGAEQLGGCRSA